MKFWSNLSKTKKKAIIGGGAAVAAVALGVGGVTVLKRNSGKPVDVYPMSMLNNAEWYETESTLNGVITSDYVQEVYLNDSLDLKKIFVKEGDTVKVGDKLLKYNVDEEEVNLKLQKLQIKSAKLEIEQMEEELDKLRKTRTVGSIGPMEQMIQMASLKLPDIQFITTVTVYAQEGSDGDTSADSTESTGSTESGSDSSTGSGGSKDEPAGSQKKDTPYDTITSVDQKSSLSGNGSSDAKKYVYLLSKSTETDEDGSEHKQRGQVKGSVINSLVSSNRYAVFREYPSKEAYKNGADAVDTFTVTPGMQFANLESDKSYTLTELQNMKISVSAVSFSPVISSVYTGQTYSFNVKVTGENVSKVKLSWSVTGNKSAGTTVSGGNLAIGSRETASYITLHVNAAGKSASMKLKVNKSSGTSGGSSTGSGTSTGGGSSYYPGGSTVNSYDDDDDDYTYTAAELREAIADKEEEIADAKHDLAEAKIAYKEAKRDVDAAIVKATVEGVVTTAYTVKEAPDDMTAVIVVRADDGMYVKANISELLFDTVKVGGKVTCTSWDTNEQYEAVVTEISDFPSSVSRNEYGMNPNSSYYPFLAYIEQADGLNTGETVSIGYSSKSMGTADENMIVIQKAYVIREHGEAYVYKMDEKNRLIKQNVKIGGTVYGQYVEILSGLTAEDYIAFPYGKNVKNGAKTQISEDESGIIY